jgi:cyclase
MKEIAPDIFIETRYAGGNVGAICTGKGVICIDIPTAPDQVSHWLFSLRQVTDEPLISLVQTDYDLYRTASTNLVDVPVIAHEAAWDRMSRLYARDKTIQQVKELLHTDQDWQVRMPDITFTERLTLTKGSREIYIVHAGGHSPATCMVQIPTEDIMFTGDVVYNDIHPDMRLAESKAWLSALTRLRKVEVTTLVPGHGAVCDRDATYSLSEYIRQIRAEVRRGFRSGRSKSETARPIIAEFLDAFPYPQDQVEELRDRIKASSDRVYDEYRAIARKKAKGKRVKRRKRS